MKKLVMLFAVVALIGVFTISEVPAPPQQIEEPPGGGGGCTTLSYAPDDFGGFIGEKIRALYSSSDCDSIRLYLMLTGGVFAGSSWGDGVQQIVFDMYHDPDMAFTGTLGLTQFINHDLCEDIPGFPIATAVTCTATTGLPGFPSSHGQMTSKVTCNILRQPPLPPGCPYMIDPFNVLEQHTVIGLQFTKTVTGQHARFGFPDDGSIPDGNPKVTTPIGILLTDDGRGGLVTIP